MTATLKACLPVDGRIYVEHPLAQAREFDVALACAEAAQADSRPTLPAECVALRTRATEGLAIRHIATAEI